jgi:hypothetical protein
VGEEVHIYNFEQEGLYHMGHMKNLKLHLLHKEDMSY